MLNKRCRSIHRIICDEILDLEGSKELHVTRMMLGMLTFNVSRTKGVAEDVRDREADFANV